MSGVSSATHYALIGLYVLFYLLDDLLIVVVAMLAIDKFAGERYAKYCKLVTGALLLVLGVILAFFPQLLA